MQLKITTDYAIRMILYLAQNESVIVSATEIAQAMKIPHSYLIQIGAVLKKAGLIQAEFCPVRKSYCLLQQHINTFLQYLTIAELLKNHISHEGPPPSSARAPQAAELSSAFLIAEKRS